MVDLLRGTSSLEAEPVRRAVDRMPSSLLVPFGLSIAGIVSAMVVVVDDLLLPRHEDPVMWEVWGFLAADTASTSLAPVMESGWCICSKWLMGRWRRSGKRFETTGRKSVVVRGLLDHSSGLCERGSGGTTGFAEEVQQWPWGLWHLSAGDKMDINNAERCAMRRACVRRRSKSEKVLTLA